MSCGIDQNSSFLWIWKSLKIHTVNIPLKGLKWLSYKCLQSHHIQGMSAFSLWIMQDSSIWLLAVHVSESFCNSYLIVCISSALVCYIWLAFEDKSYKLEIQILNHFLHQLKMVINCLMNVLNTCLDSSVSIFLSVFAGSSFSLSF